MLDIRFSFFTLEEDFREYNSGQCIIIDYDSDYRTVVSATSRRIEMIKAMT